MSLTTFSQDLTELSRCQEHPPLTAPQSLKEAEAWDEIIRKSCSPYARREHLRWLARNSLYYLLCYLLRRPDCKQQWILERCLEVQEEPDNCLDFWSRGGYKSTILSFTLPIQDILINPELGICFLSHTRPIARSLLRVVKTELEENEELKILFDDVLWATPQTEAPMWSETEGLIVKRRGNRPEATFEAFGLIDGMPIRKHYDIRIYDDVITEANVSNPDQIRKATDKFDISQALATGKRAARVVGTYYDPDGDTYQDLEDKQFGKPRVRPAGYNDAYPDSLTPEILSALQRTMSPKNFALQYAMDRQTAKDNKVIGFKEEDIVWEDTPPPLASMHIYLLVDPAGGEDTSHSKTAMWVIGLTHDRQRHVIDGLCDHLDLPARWKAVEGYVQKYQPNLKGVIYEKYSMQADYQYIEEKRKAANLHFNMILVGGFHKKTRRIDVLYSPFAARKFVFLREIWQRDKKGDQVNIVQHFIRGGFSKYPHTKDLDQLDCLSRIDDPEVIPILTYPRPYGLTDAQWGGGMVAFESGGSWMSR